MLAFESKRLSPFEISVEQSSHVPSLNRSGRPHSNEYWLVIRGPKENFSLQRIRNREFAFRKQLEQARTELNSLLPMESPESAFPEYHALLSELENLEPPSSTDRHSLEENQRALNEKTRRLRMVAARVTSPVEGNRITELIDEIAHLSLEIRIHNRLYEAVRHTNTETLNGHEALLEKLNAQIAAWKERGSTETDLAAFHGQLKTALNLSAKAFLDSIKNPFANETDPRMADPKKRQLVQRLSDIGFQDETSSVSKENAFRLATALGPIQSHEDARHVEELKSLIGEFMHRHGFYVRY